MQAGARQDWRTGWAQDAAIATALAVLLAAIGPFGSFLNGPFWQRLLFQAPCSWLAVGLIGTGVRLALARFGGGWRLWTAVVIVAALAMLPIALVNMAMAAWLWPFLSAHMTFFTWWWEGLLIAEPAAFVFAWLGLRRRARIEGSSEADAGLPIAPGLLAMAPLDVVCLQMEDHYVRVHAAERSVLVLATFGQAEAALEDAPGLRVHRSWWVADGALARAELHGRNLRLILVNGLDVPVARSSVSEVRARGWLKGERGVVRAKGPLPRAEAAPSSAR